MISSAFPRDPYGHATNQSGHFVIGLALAVALSAFGLPWQGTLPLAVLLYWCVVEVASQKLTLLRDSIEDALFVLFGAGMPILLVEWGDIASVLYLGNVACVLGVGVWRRL